MRRVKNFWNLEACKNFLRSIKIIFVKNLKIGHLKPKMTIWLIDYSDERIKDKKMRFKVFER